MAVNGLGRCRATRPRICPAPGLRRSFCSGFRLALSSSKDCNALLVHTVFGSSEWKEARLVQRHGAGMTVVVWLELNESQMTKVDRAGVHVRLPAAQFSLPPLAFLTSTWVERIAPPRTPVTVVLSRVTRED